LTPEEKYGFGPRFYRSQMGHGRFKAFEVSFKDSDLWIGVDSKSFIPDMVDFARSSLIALRQELEEFILRCPQFRTSFSPIEIGPFAPDVAISMCNAGKIAGTGPMAAVAGAFSEVLGKALKKKFKIGEIIVENGGDIYLDIQKDIVLSVYAGNSPLSGKIGVQISHEISPLGVCTSAGKIGPSVSFGRADAVMVACYNTALSDALATALGNLVTSPEDIKTVITKAQKYSEIISAIIICDDKIGVSGQLSICPINSLP